LRDIFGGIYSIWNPVPHSDLVDYLASRYGQSPFDVEGWDFFDSIVYYYAGARNEIRHRLAVISDLVATGEMSAEIKHYDKHGKEIKPEGRSDPVGFKRHVKKLYEAIGLGDDGSASRKTMSKKEREERRRKAADVAMKFFSRHLGGGG